MPNYAIDPATSPYARAIYDVSQEAYGNNVPIDALADRSGNGLTVSGSGTARPLCLTNALNGSRVARFDGVNDLLAAATASDWTFLHDGHPLTILAVVRQTSGVNPNRTEAVWGTSAVYMAFTDTGTTPNNALWGYIGGATNPIVDVTIEQVLRPPTWHILAMRYSAGVRSLEDGSAGNDLVLYVDGIPVGGEQSANLPHNTTAPSQGLALGALPDASAPAQIDLAWLGFFVGALPRTLFSGYMEYVARRYGLGLTYAANDGYAQCAFPGLTRVKDGTLLMGYSNKSYHNPQPKGVLVVKRTGDGGRTWGVERKVVSHATLGYSDVNLLTHALTGTVLLSTFHSDITTDVLAEIFRSTDQGTTWSSAISMTTGFTLYSASAGGSCVLSNGYVLVPVYGKNTGDSFDSVKCLTSTDDGLTWGSPVYVINGQAASISYSECSLVKLSGTYPTETLLAVLRNDTTGKIVKSTSTNSGATWSAVSDVKTGVTGRPFVFLAASGKLYLLARLSASPSRGVLYWSSDNGATWSTNPYALDAIDGFNTYAAAVEVSAGKFLIVTSSEFGVNVSASAPAHGWVRGMIHDEANINLIT